MIPAVRRFLKYSLVGVVTFSFDLLLLFWFVDVWGMPSVGAAGVAFVIAVSVNYLLSRRFVFSGSLRSAGAGYANFILIAGAGLLLVTGGMYVLETMFGFDYLLARISVASLTGFWNYLMNLFVNFKVSGKH